MSKKNFLAETLAEIESIKKSVQENANYALKSTLKDDLESIVKNGLNEADEIETDEMGDEMDSPDFESMDNNTEEMGLDSEDLMDEPVGDDTMMDEPAEEFGDDEEFETIDLTDKEDDEVINHFNLMDPADEIEIVRTDDGISINIKTQDEPLDDVDVEPEAELDSETGDELNFSDDDELEIEFDDEEGGESEEDEDNIPINEEDDTHEHEEPVLGNKTGMSGKNSAGHDHEVHENFEEHEEPILGNKTGMSGKNSAGHDHEVHEQTKELRESLVRTRKKLSTLVSENKKKDEELKDITSLVENFKISENEYKKAISSLKNQLEEVALFTSNLTYAIKLMTENSTTKDEKLDILKRFDSAKTLTESREIYNSLGTLFQSKTSTNKIVENKVLDTDKTSGTSQINESTAYKNPQLTRMLDIISKIK